MELYRIVSEVIDFRSFSNLWFWIVLAVLWSVSSHWVLGVPYDMIQRARRQGGQAALDVETIAAINARRVLGVARTAAMPLFFTAAFLFSSLVLLGFWYWVEFAQALVLLLSPLMLVVWLSLHTALRLETGEDHGEALLHRLLIHRRLVQVIGICAIFVTGLFGMWRNLSYSILN